jgi:hypothetical protein
MSGFIPGVTHYCVHCNRMAAVQCSSCGAPTCHSCKVVVRRRVYCQTCNPSRSARGTNVMWLGDRRRA